MGGTRGLQRLRRWLGEVGSLIDDAVNVAVAGAFLLGGAGAGAGALRTGSLWVAVLAAGCLVGFSFSLGWFVRSRHHCGPDTVTHPVTALGYVWPEAEFILEFDPTDPRRMTQTSRITVRAVRNHVHIVENRYRWTGQGAEPLPQALRSGQQILSTTPIHRDDDCRTYYVFLTTPLDRDETTTIAIRQDFCDSGGVMQPRLSKTVTEHITSLILTVRLPRELLPAAGAEATGVEYEIHDGERRVVGKTVLSFDDRGQVRWECGDIVRGHRYELDWQWHNYPPSEVDVATAEREGCPAQCTLLEAPRDSASASASASASPEVR